MKKFLLALLVMLVFVTGCSSNNQSNNDESSGNTNESQDATNDQTTTEDSNILIAYFSKTGNTEAIAQEIQSLTNGTLVEIETVESEKEANARPEISTTVDNMDQYDTIFIGYPIWWHDAPMAVYTFLENYDFEGKTVIPFCTSGGSDIEESIPGIEAAVSGATMLEGLTANDSSDVQPWLEEIGILK